MSLKNFQMLEKLGEGAFSIVNKVRRLSDDQIYAMKQVKMGSLKTKEKENALNEVRILASVNHPNIVEMKEVFIDESSNKLCIVMEFADGGDLLQKIQKFAKSGGNFSERELWKIISGLINGLKKLHGMKIVHRDIKSANIFLYRNGVAKLGDLNVSKVAKRGLVYTQTGTPYYACPEVWKDKPYDLKSDIWSLGCVIYEAATKNPPFKAQNMQQLYQAVLRGTYSPLPTTYSRDLSSTIAAMLQVNPTSRPTCDALLEMPCVAKNMSGQRSASTDCNSSLLATIKLPNNWRALNNQLPKPNYDGERDRGSHRDIVHRNRRDTSLPASASASERPRYNHSYTEEERKYNHPPSSHRRDSRAEIIKNQYLRPTPRHGQPPLNNSRSESDYSQPQRRNQSDSRGHHDYPTNVAYNQDSVRSRLANLKKQQDIASPRAQINDQRGLPKEFRQKPPRY